MQGDEEGGSAWYRHFWPWFIVVLLGVSVVGSLVTVTIAYRLGDLEIASPARTEPAVDGNEAPGASSGETF